MMDFFIALFGGAYWGAKICSDKIKSSSYNRLKAKADEAYKKGYKEWEEKVTDRELEISVKERLNEDWEYRDEIYSEMLEEFGEMYIPKIAAHQIPTNVYYVLAKHGKIPDSAAMSGIRVIGATQARPSTILRWEKEMFFINWIHKQLVEHHGEDASKLMFEPYQSATIIPIESMEKYVPGEVIWSASSILTYWDMFR